MPIRLALALGLLAGGAASGAGAQWSDDPASAIPWLSDTLRPGGGAPSPPPRAGALPPDVSVEAIGGPRRAAAGLLPASVTGLPPDAWTGAEVERLIARIAELRPGALPAAGELARLVLLAELDPPRQADDPAAERLFLARVDALLRMGALEEAQGLLERAGAADAQAFRRWFDAALLTGEDARACAALNASPGISPRLPARIFCLSRGGDWMAAALTLDTGRALGLLSEEEDALLGRFLDPELFEGLPSAARPRPMTPLAFRLLDGVGEAPATRDLPLAFAVADLRPVSGWKARLEAGERLARAGAMDANRLLALYTEARPSASGGAWDRAQAIQRLDAALMGGDGAAVAAALPDAWARMEAAGLLLPLARMLGARLAAVPAQGEAAATALRLGLLSDDYAAVARAAARPDAPRDAFAWALARGDAPAEAPEALRGDPMVAALVEGFAAPAEPPAPDRLAARLLETAGALAPGRDAAPDAVASAIATLRGAGREDAARRAALQLLLT
jgi:hypothetical protein